MYKHMHIPIMYKAVASKSNQLVCKIFLHVYLNVAEGSCLFCLVWGFLVQFLDARVCLGTRLLKLLTPILDHLYTLRTYSRSLWGTVLTWGKCSLVPRPPCFRTRTLKLYRRGEPGIFSHPRRVNGREEVRDLNCVWAYPKAQNRKKSEGRL